MKLLEEIYDTVAPMLTKKGKLRSPLLPSANKLRDVLVTGPVDRGLSRPEMVDVGTDTALTPNWWESEQERRKKESSRRRAAKASARGSSAVENHADTGAESLMETDGEGAKPPAVLVKVAAGSSYADTVRAVRNNSEVNLVELGAQVTGMRKTRDGHLLVELAKVTTEGEVLSALRAAIPGSEDEQTAICERQAVQITGLWSTRSGQQIATARMTRASAAIVTRVPIGWTMCPVRPRRPEPEKCFRCHGFGHRSDNCSGPDLSLNCRRCGEPGHELKVCLADKDRCVACERAGIERFEQKPGSGMFKARKEALKIPAGHNSQAQSWRETSGDGTRSKQ
ncbi:hypothetical protein QTP88_012550 [Uroleucon formosanum]